MSAIVALAHALELNVIAEGIETQEQLRFLTAANCKYGQGYLFGKAMKPEAFESALNLQRGYADIVERTA